jgi:hypothetical protein
MEAIPINPRDFTQLDLRVEKVYVEIRSCVYLARCEQFRRSETFSGVAVNQEGT